jgi:hypothetical protein
MIILNPCESRFGSPTIKKFCETLKRAPKRRDPWLRRNARNPENRFIVTRDGQIRQY